MRGMDKLKSSVTGINAESFPGDKGSIEQDIVTFREIKTCDIWADSWAHFYPQK